MVSKIKFFHFLKITFRVIIPAGFLLSAPKSKCQSATSNLEWQCEHCTYINDPSTRICGVCCKTSENPYLFSKRQPRRVSSPANSVHSETASRRGGRSQRSDAMQLIKEQQANEIRSAKSKVISKALQSEKTKRKYNTEVSTSKLVGDTHDQSKEVKLAKKKISSSSQGKSFITANEDFEFKSFKSLKSPKSSKVRRKKTDDTSDQITTGSSAVSEPMYQNEQELNVDARNVLTKQVEDMHINQDSEDSNRIETEKNADTETKDFVSEEAATSKKKKDSFIRKNKKSSMTEEGKRTKERHQKDSRYDKTPPRPMQEKPRFVVGNKKAAQSCLSNNLPPPPSFEDSRVPKKAPVPSPIVQRRDKPRLPTPPADTYDNAEVKTEQSNGDYSSTNSESAEIKAILQDRTIHSPKQTKKSTTEPTYNNTDGSGPTDLAETKLPLAVAATTEFINAQQEAERVHKRFIRK